MNKAETLMADLINRILKDQAVKAQSAYAEYRYKSYLIRQVWGIATIVHPGMPIDHKAVMKNLI